MTPHPQLRLTLSFFISCLLLHIVSVASTALNETANNDEPCPVSSRYCKCSGEPFYRIHCKNITDLTSLYEVTRNFTDITLILELDLLNFTALSPQVLDTSSLMSVIIKNSTFRNIFNVSGLDQMSNSSSIHHLALENVTAEEWSWDQFRFLRQLDVFFAYNTTIGHNITSSFGQHMSKTLKLLSISGSNISSIERDSFRHLNNLTYLRISHSKLTTLSRNILPAESKLEQLKLDHNQIASLSNDMFTDFANLSYVSLSNNRINYLPEEVFRPLWKSNIKLELRDNPIKCDCRMRWTVTSTNKPHIIGKCSKPKNLHEKNIKDLVITDLNC